MGFLFYCVINANSRDSYLPQDSKDFRKLRFTKYYAYDSSQNGTKSLSNKCIGSSRINPEARFLHIFTVS